MARPALVLIAVGQDRPGLVDRVSGSVYEAGCNIEDSRMSVLGGEFALMVLVTGSEEGLATVRSGVTLLSEELGLSITAKSTRTDDEADAIDRSVRVCEVRAVAVDHPGIVHTLTGVLARCGVNVARLDTSLRHAPTTGTPLFELRLEAHVPPEASMEELDRQLREAAQSADIDIELSGIDAEAP